MIPRRRNAALAVLLLTGCSQQAATVDDTSATTASTVATTTTDSVPTTSQEVPEAPTQPTTPKLPTPHAPPEPRAKEPVVDLGSIEIPRLDIDTTLFEGITLNTLDRGPGHWPGTAMPGALGNVVVGGHRTSKSRPFRHLERLKPGDEVILTTNKGRFVYLVTSTEIVTPDSIWIVDQTNAYTATLFACHPVGSTKERIVVFLELSV